MAELSFQVRTERLANGTNVVVADAFGTIGSKNVAQLEELFIDHAFNRGIKHVVVTCSNLSYASSTGLGLLIKFADKFVEAGGGILLVDVSENMVALLELLGVRRLFVIFSTVRDALQSI